LPTVDSGKLNDQSFVKNAAHELRTPLAAITSAVEVLQNGAKEDPADRDRFLDHIQRAAGRLDRLLDALLVLARAQTGEEEPTLARVAIEPILERVLEGIKAYAGVAVEIESERGLVVETNPQLLEQLLANLAANAAQHTDSGSIRLVARGEDHHVSIEVRDTGHGLEPVDLELIERELARREAPELAGLGIGLTIVREAVRALGGEVEIGPRSGGGTTARVLLPLAEERKDDV